MQRYSIINEGLKRELLLLQGTGCKWRKCTFCDYHTDVSSDPFEVNRTVLSMVTGCYGRLDIINSGSCFELDEETLKYIRDIADEKSIGEIWFECHWMYRDCLDAFRARFPRQMIKFRTGVESFDGAMRALWNKGIDESVSAEEISAYFDGCTLLAGIKGQTRKAILSDIATAEKYFEYYSVNLFCSNSTKTMPDPDLASFVRTSVKDMLKGSVKAEILLENTDLGVG